MRLDQYVERAAERGREPGWEEGQERMTRFG